MPRLTQLWELSPKALLGSRIPAKSITLAVPPETQESLAIQSNLGQEIESLFRHVSATFRLLIIAKSISSIPFLEGYRTERLWLAFDSQLSLSKAFYIENTLRGRRGAFLETIRQYLRIEIHTAFLE